MIKRLALAVAAILAMSGFSSAASAQATRTWVSGVGDDMNPCSRTAPCKTFAGAISKTAANGEINCLDPGGFGGVTITKPISIVCDYTEGGVLSGGNAITVNLASGGNVLLSGLDVVAGNPSNSGVRIVGSGMIHIRNTTISGFNSGSGISFEPAGTSTLIVSRSAISGNKTGISTAGRGQAIVSDTLIAGNGTGLASSGDSRLLSAGSNIVAGNGSDGKFSGAVARQ